MEPLARGLALLKARALEKVSPKLAVPILEHLEGEVPSDMQVKRLLARCYFEACEFRASLPIWLFLFIREQDDDALWHLLSCCYATDTVSCFLHDFKIISRLSISQKQLATFLLAGNALEGIEHAVSQRHLRYLLIWKTRKPAVPVIPTTPTTFSVSYEYALWCIFAHDFSAAFDILKDAFRQGSEYELLEYIKERQKLDILYFLKRCTILRYYFDEAKKKICDDKIKVIYALLKGRSLKLEEAVNFL